MVAGVAGALMVWMAVCGVAVAASATPDGLLLWNKLGSDGEVQDSGFGPDLSFYGGMNHTYVTGKFGKALSIAPGDYYSMGRYRNAVLSNVGSLLSAERGTIELWFLQTADPVPYVRNPYRAFDGAFGLDSSVWLESQGDNDRGEPRFELMLRGKNGEELFANSITDGYRGVNISALNGQWVHVAGVWDRNGIDGTTDTIRLYVNGVEKADSKARDWVTAFTGDADIGGANDYDIVRRFAVDNIKIWNYAKTDFSDRFREDPTGFRMDFAVAQAQLRFGRPATTPATAPIAPQCTACGPRRGQDSARVQGKLRLADESNGIHPDHEAVKIGIGSYTVTIPAGSFRRGANGYRYRGTINDGDIRVEMAELAANHFDLRICASGIDLSGTANPVTLTVVIGDDRSLTEEWLQGVLQRSGR
jgi:hypothetical protein